MMRGIDNIPVSSYVFWLLMPQLFWDRPLARTVIMVTKRPRVYLSAFPLLTLALLALAPFGLTE
ncbi:MAG TPA: hypothetical protein DDZ58_08700 [Achromobacter sp.]|nr:hypothetical protein [Achromobacter sp.]